MTKIEGSALHDLDTKDIPEDLVLLVQEMLARLKSCGIRHNDLHMGNLIYNPLHHAVHPIDINNSLDRNVSQLTMDQKEENFLLEMQTLVNLKKSS